MLYTLYIYCTVGTMLYKESIAFNLLEDKPTYQIHRYLVYTEADKSSKTLGDINNRMITEEAMGGEWLVMAYCAASFMLYLGLPPLTRRNLYLWCKGNVMKKT